MARGLNKIMVIGNLGRDPQMRYTPSGAPVTNFSVAVSRTFKGQEGDSREETEWFNVVAWRQLAEICNEYLKKGSKVYIEGRLQTRQYQDQQGQQRTSVEIVASDMMMLDSRGGPDARATGDESGAGVRGGADQDGGDEDVDELPF